MNLNNFTFKNIKNVFVKPSITPPPTATRVSRFLEDFNMRKTKGFTLAETLITLGIIGIVAAMTVPTLIEKYEEVQIISGVKAAYSILQHVVTTSIAENGSIDTWGLEESIHEGDHHKELDKNIAKQYIIPYLKIAGECTVAKGDCFAYHDKSYPTMWYGSDGTQVGAWAYGGPYRAYMVKLANGMHLAISTYAPLSLDNHPAGVKFLIDINGSKGGSVMGRDVFIFSINEYDQRLVPGIQTYVASWGDEPNNCSANYRGGTGTAFCGVSTGCGCAKLLIENSYQFPKKYDIKKIPKRGIKT